MKKWLVAIIIVVVIIAGYFWMTYNGLVTLNEEVDNQWAQVQTQYQRRYDLIPNLVESVKGVMKQEQSIFTALAEARTKYGSASGTSAKAEAATQVESALSRLLVVMENYPELKSAETVQTLMAQLEGTENRISVERKRFNDTAKVFNVRIKTLPTSLVAQMFGFSVKQYFESTTGAENAPKVNL